MRPWIWIVVAACFAASSAGAAPSLVTSRGRLAEAGVDKSVFSFRFDRDQKRFVLRLDETNEAAVLAVLQAATAGGGPLVVRFDAYSGAFARSAPEVPTYQVRELAYETVRATVGGGAVTAPPAPSDAKGQLALGVALAASEDYPGAKAALDQALAGGLPKTLKALAHRKRGEIAQGHAYLSAVGPTADGDLLLVAALGDMRSWRTLEPENFESSQGVASALSDLGAYDEALAIYAGLDDPLWSGIRIGAIYRARREYEKALAALDEIVRRSGPQDGMGWHYHRGWILSEMGRHAEAVTEFSIGLKSQPEYAWAMLRRACSLGRLGRYGEALADQQQASIHRARSVADLTTSPAILHDDARVAAVTEALKVAVASGRADGSDVACGGYWGADGRSRSPLLPAS